MLKTSQIIDSDAYRFYISERFLYLLRNSLYEEH